MTTLKPSASSFPAVASPSIGASSPSPYTYRKTVTGSYYEEFVELYELIGKREMLKNFEHRFFDISFATLGDYINEKSFNFKKEHDELARIEARIEEIISGIK